MQLFISRVSIPMQLFIDPLLAALAAAVAGLTLLLPRPDLAAACVLLLTASYQFLQQDGRSAVAAPAAAAPAAVSGLILLLPRPDLAAACVLLLAASFLLLQHCSASAATTTKCSNQAEVYELKGQYYQRLGDAWDHETKQFKVVYRPLYHCEAACGRFEAHVLATSHFSRWEEKFKAVDTSSLPPAVAALLLAGPFVLDPEWQHERLSAPFPAGVSTSRSGLACRRSHQPPRLEDIIGDYRRFISHVHARLLRCGLDAISRGYEMDHICFRTASKEEYDAVLSALAPAFGSVLVEGVSAPLETHGQGLAAPHVHAPCVAA